MTSPDNPTPAIVIGRGYTALSALRALAAAGIPAYVACPPGDLVTRSRWYRPTPGPVRWNGDVGPHAHEILHDMPLARAVLIPCACDVAQWVSQIAVSDLSQRFRVCSSSHETLELLQDKSRFGTFLAHHGVAYPRTYPIASLADISAIPFGEIGRVFIQPIDSRTLCGTWDSKGLWAISRAECEAIWRRLNADGFKVIAQEYVPGSAADHYFVEGFRDRAGALTGLFARKRTRSSPAADPGDGAHGHSIPLAQVGNAVDSLTAVLAMLRYRGVFSAQFKRDSNSGTLHILEINTRVWGYVKLAARHGINVCAMAFADADDWPVANSPAVQELSVA